MTANVRTDFGRDVYAVLGLPFDAVTQQGAVARLRQAMENREPCLWVTPNVNFVAASQNDIAFRSAILKAHLSTVDGMPLVWLARLMGIPLPERVSGSDVFDRLCNARDAGPARTVFLYGGDDGVARVAHNELNARQTAMRSVGWLSPGRGSVTELSRAGDLEAIRNAHADFLLVSLGAVKGHSWIDRNWQQVDTPVVSHLGAVINFLAGSVRRAPEWMQRFGLEWLWRIYQENTLWKRYYYDGKKLFSLLRKSLFLYIFLRKKWSRLVEQHPPQISVSTAAARDVWTLTGVFSADGLNELRQLCDGLNRQPTDLTVDLTGLCWLDSAAMGVLLLLHAHQCQENRALAWQGDAARQIFAAHGCEYLFQGMASRPIR